MPEDRTPRLTISTPEGIVFSLPLAGPVTRFLAWGIDAAITTVILIVIMTILSLAAGPAGMGSISGLAQAALMILFFGTKLAYNMSLEWLWRGQTPGKFLLGIRVMDVQGLHLQFSQIALRNLMRFLDILPLLYLVGGTAMILNARHQRLGDLAANTVVIRRRRLPQPDLDRILPGKYNSFRAFPHLEARLRQRISPEEALLALRALLRREELDPPSRLQLYRELAAHFQSRVPFPEEALVGLTDEQYLRNAVESLYRNPSGQN